MSATRTCPACGQLRDTLAFSRPRRICNSCVEGRFRGATPVGAARAPTYQPYDGAELRPYAGRPGAMDAFARPSLLLGQRTLPKDAGRPNDPPPTDRSPL